MLLVIGGIAGFLAALVFFVLLRERFGTKFEIRNPEILLALILVALWLFLTGRVQELGFGDLKIVSAIKSAATTKVEKKVTALPVERIQIGAKGQLVNLEALVATKPQALLFDIGDRRYSGPAILQYLDALTRTPRFRYLVFEKPDGTFYALADARQVAAGAHSGAIDLQRIADSLNEARTNELVTLPGYTPANDALRSDLDTRTALEKMNALDVQTLPVVDASGHLAGVVDRSKLSASMLIEIAEQVQR